MTNILIYVAYKTPCSTKPSCIIFDKVDNYIRKHNATNYRTLFD